MGKSKSNSSSTSKNTIINKNMTDTLNKTVMNSAVETLVKNASTCSSSVNQNNTCSMANADIGGNFNFSGNQSNKAKVNFSCIQADKTSANMATSMMQSIMAEMKTLNGTKAAAQLNSSAASSNKSGFGSTGGSSSSSSNTASDTEITNITQNKVRNVYQQNLSNNFTSETVSECIGKTTQSNNQNLSGIKVGGNANVKCNQSNTLEQVQECKQMSEAISATTQKTLQELGIKTDTASETTTSTVASSEATSENVSTGPIQDAGAAIAGVVGAVGNLFGMGILATMMPFICCVVIAILIFMFLPNIFSMFSGSSSSVAELSSVIPQNINFPVPENISSNISKENIMSNSPEN